MNISQMLRFLSSSAARLALCELRPPPDLTDEEAAELGACLVASLARAELPEGADIGTLTLSIVHSRAGCDKAISAIRCADLHWILRGASNPGATALLLLRARPDLSPAIHDCAHKIGVVL